MDTIVSHNCFRGPRATFIRWREAVAYAADYAVYPVMYESGLVDTILLDWGHMTRENFEGQWEKVPEDPLLILFVHNEGSGIITPEHCRLLAGRLEEVAPDMEDTGPDGSPRARTLQFVKGLQSAARAGEPVAFSE